MRKSKLFKGLVLAMAMVMLLSVTAFAGSSVSWYTSDGISAMGVVSFSSATTDASEYASVYVEVAFHYIDAYNRHCTVYDNASNVAKTVHAFASVPSGYAVHNATYGTHTVNGSTKYTEYR